MTIALVVECDNKVSSKEIGKQLAAFYRCIKMKTMVWLITTCQLV